jgi:hypothetical protein
LVGLVACSSQKRDQAAPARLLYDPSALFRASLAYAEAACEVVLVLSAKHYVLDLGAVTEPYDHRLRAAVERVRWGAVVADRLVTRFGVGTEYLLLAGEDYVRPVVDAMGARGGFYLPLAGKQIGERLQWLGQQGARS